MLAEMSIYMKYYKHVTEKNSANYSKLSYAAMSQIS